MSDTIKPPARTPNVEDILLFYKEHRIPVQYRSMEILRAATVQVKTVRGTNDGRYSIITIEEVRKDKP